MPNTINLRLLDNKNIIAELNGIPLAQENSYKIIAGEENATIFKIASKPEQYKNASYTVEMVNSQGFGIDEAGIIDDTFTLPVGMAVAGYGWVQIRAYQGEEKVPFMTLKIKVWNTLPNWKEHISEGGGGGITQETDPTVPAWAKKPNKPTYTYDEITEKPDYIENAGIIKTNGDANKFLNEKGQYVEVTGGSGGGSSITVDSVLSNTSANPVQNKVITNELDNIDKTIGDAETALDNIIELQEAYIGGGGSDKVLSSNDYTDADKNKLASMKTESWVFTLEDGSTVTKSVVVM